MLDSYIGIENIKLGEYTRSLIIINSTLRSFISILSPLSLVFR